MLHVDVFADLCVIVVAASAVASLIPPISVSPINTVWSWSLPPKAVQGLGMSSCFSFPNYALSHPYSAPTPFNNRQGKKFFDKTVGSGANTASVQAYCVECGVTGQFNIVGTLKANPLAFSVAQASLSVLGPMKMNTEIGVVFSGTLNQQFSIHLFDTSASSRAPRSRPEV
jgi:hypothetical protein